MLPTSYVVNLQHNQENKERILVLYFRSDLKPHIPLQVQGNSNVKFWGSGDSRETTNQIMCRLKPAARTLSIHIYAAFLNTFQVAIWGVYKWHHLGKKQKKVIYLDSLCLHKRQNIYSIYYRAQVCTLEEALPPHLVKGITQ